MIFELWVKSIIWTLRCFCCYCYYYHYLFMCYGFLSSFGVFLGFRPGHSCTWKHNKTKQNKVKTMQDSMVVAFPSSLPHGLLRGGEASWWESTEPLPMALQWPTLSLPQAPELPAMSELWQALWPPRMWQTQTPQRNSEEWGPLSLKAHVQEEQ